MSTPFANPESSPNLTLDPLRIVRTVEQLRDRIAERFPGSGLSQLALQLQAVAANSVHRLDWVSRPYLPLRIGIGFLIVLMFIVFGAVIFQFAHRPSGLDTLKELLDTTSNVLADFFYIGAVVLFLVTLEGRVKRRRALRFLRELRELAHIVDMHQLTKDPDRLVTGGADTPSSPPREMSRFELGRYLDYCSEMLSLISKIAALYVQKLDDPVVLAAVDEVETLTTGLSRKIWQKITLLDRAGSSLG